MTSSKGIERKISFNHHVAARIAAYPFDIDSVDDGLGIWMLEHHENLFVRYPFRERRHWHRLTSMRDNNMHEICVVRHKY